MIVGRMTRSSVLTNITNTATHNGAPNAKASSKVTPNSGFAKQIRMTPELNRTPLSCSTVGSADFCDDSSVDDTPPPTRKFIFAELDLDPSCNGNDIGYHHYCNDIYDNMRANELVHYPCIDYMKVSQKHINHKIRGILIDWLVEVADEYTLGPQSLFLSVCILDSFLRIYRDVERQKLQLVGIAAMLIATKYEETHPPTAKEFSYMSDYTYTTGEVLKMEKIMLVTLRFRLSAVTAFEFRRRFLFSVPNEDSKSDRIGCLTNFLLELALQDAINLRYRPSILASASIALAFLMTDFKSSNDVPWTASLRHNTGFSYEDVRDCVVSLHALHIRVRMKGKSSAVVEKYQVANQCQVAYLLPANFVP